MLFIKALSHRREGDREDTRCQDQESTCMITPPAIYRHQLLRVFSEFFYNQPQSQMFSYFPLNLFVKIEKDKNYLPLTHKTDVSASN